MVIYDRNILDESDVVELIEESSWPKHWKQTSLTDERYFNIETGIWIGEKAPLIECSVIRNTNFSNDGFLDMSNVASIPIEERHLNRKKLSVGDIIIERSGGGPRQPVGRVVYFDKTTRDYCFSNFTSRVRVLNQRIIEPYFLHLYLYYFHASGQTEHLQRRTTGIRNLSFADYKAMSIPLPPLPEQRAIARALRAVQDAILARRREVALERERKAALMQHLFTYGTRGEPTKQTEIGEMPKSWEITSLERAFKFTSKPKNISYKEYPKLPFLPMEMVPLNGAHISSYQIRKLDEIASGTYFEDNDLLLAKITPSFENGKQGIATQMPLPFGIASTEIIPLKGIAGKSWINYLSHYLLLPIVRNELAGKMEGTTGRQRLGKATLASMILPLPSFEEQQEIAKILNACDSYILALINEISSLQELFRAMLEELMTGQLSALPLVQVGDE